MSDDRTPDQPYKAESFDKFLEILEEGTDAHWLEIAEALKVNKDTITVWKTHPRAQQSIQKGISHALSMMKKSGADDWKMWDKIATRLGAQVIEKTDVTSDGEKIEGVVIYKPEKNTQ